MARRKKIYLDYAASTPTDPRVFRAMEPYFGERFGNPGSLHGFGQEAMTAVDASREFIARSIGAGFREIIFTGSATEANNCAVRGSVRGFLRATADRRGTNFDICGNGIVPPPRIIISAIEHDSVLETARDMQREGVEVVLVPVTREGVVDLKKLEDALNERTVLVSVMYANNEIGTIQPISEIAQIIHNFRESIVNSPTDAKALAGKQMSKVGTMYPLFHTDAVQAFQFLNCNVDFLGVDMMTFSSHKIYGPKGAGALYVSEKSKIKNQKSKNENRFFDPIITGGGQEYGIRSGTENVPAIVGLGKAVEILGDERKRHAQRTAEFTELLWGGIKKIYPDAEANGSFFAPIKTSELRKGKRGTSSLPNILNVYFPGREAQEMVTHLDLHGVAVSSGSACSVRAIKPSHVINALGHDVERARQSIRFSLGRGTKKEDITQTIDILKKIF